MNSFKEIPNKALKLITIKILGCVYTAAVPIADVSGI
jgi:hypothetical protein